MGLYVKGVPGCSDGKEFTCNAGDPCSIPGLRISSEKGNGYPLQYSRLENRMNGGAWWTTVHGIAESDMTKRQNTLPCTLYRATWQNKRDD